MAYTPPSGWIEEQEPPAGEADSRLGVFHSRADCPRITEVGRVRAVERPFSARRCIVCAAVNDD